VAKQAFWISGTQWGHVSSHCWSASVASRAFGCGDAEWQRDLARTHEDEPEGGGARQCIQQRRRNRQVQHGGLIHQQRVELQRIAGVKLKPRRYRLLTSAMHS